MFWGKKEKNQHDVGVYVILNLSYSTKDKDKCHEYILEQFAVVIISHPQL